MNFLLMPDAPKMTTTPTSANTTTTTTTPTPATTTTTITTMTTTISTVTSTIARHTAARETKAGPCLYSTRIHELFLPQVNTLSDLDENRVPCTGHTALPYRD